MCGINGYISKVKNETEITSALEAMNLRILHRGPDQDGFFVERAPNATVGMAMRRLSIIDLSTGKQPLYSQSRNAVVVFNGEIYNYLELREKLVAQGVVFSTKSDTEVIVNLYEKYGVDSFAMLDGMFAFSLFDRKKNKVFIARDFFGEKPLHYSVSNDGFVWASEIKSILPTLSKKPTIDRTALNLFLQLTYIPAPHTIYSEIKKLEANHYLAFDCAAFELKIHEIRQQKLSFPKFDKIQAAKTTRDLVQKSVASRAIADVPLGTFLSGGVDSSIVSLCLSQLSDRKIETFSIGFDKKSFDETDKSRAVAKIIGSNHHEFVISEKDLSGNIHDILLNFDEPFADSSALASYVVANRTRQSVTVALTGDGGDEVFGGYNKYYIGKLNARYTSIVPKMLHSGISSVFSSLLRTSDDNRGKRFKANKLLKSINYEGDFYYNIISLGYTPQQAGEILKSGLFEPDALLYYKKIAGDANRTLTDFRNIDRLLSLEGDMLVKVDRTAMLTSLECRAPFLNKELWQFTASLPEAFLMNGWDKKHILKEAFKDYFPKGFLDKSKKGFGVPVGDWLRTDLRAELESYCDVKFLENQDLFNANVVRDLVFKHLEAKVDNTFRVWTFYCFQKWYAAAYAD